MDYGFAAVVASSFGDIFQNNSAKQGLVTVQLTATEVSELTQIIRDDPARLVVVDVERRCVEVPAAGWRREFTLDAMTQERLLRGWDDIAITLRRSDDITRFESTSDQPTVADLFGDVGRARYA